MCQMAPALYQILAYANPTKACAFLFDSLLYLLSEKSTARRRGDAIMQLVAWSKHVRQVYGAGKTESS
jgi:hypothetical protein